MAARGNTAENTANCQNDVINVGVAALCVWPVCVSVCVCVCLCVRVCVCVSVCVCMPAVEKGSFCFAFKRIDMGEEQALCTRHRDNTPPTKSKRSKNNQTRA